MKPAAGGWFALDGDDRGREDNADDDPFCSSLDSIVTPTRWIRGINGDRASRDLDGGERGEDSGRGGCWGTPPLSGDSWSRQCNLLMVSYERGVKSDMVQCLVIRDVSAFGIRFTCYLVFFLAFRRRVNRFSGLEVVVDQI